MFNGFPHKRNIILLFIFKLYSWFSIVPRFALKTSTWKISGRKSIVYHKERLRSKHSTKKYSKLSTINCNLNVHNLLFQSLISFFQNLTQKLSESILLSKLILLALLVFFNFSINLLSCFWEKLFKCLKQQNFILTFNFTHFWTA